MSDDKHKYTTAGATRILRELRSKKKKTIESATDRFDAACALVKSVVDAIAREEVGLAELRKAGQWRITREGDALTVHVDTKSGVITVANDDKTRKESLPLAYLPNERVWVEAANKNDPDLDEHESGTALLMQTLAAFWK